VKKPTVISTFSGCGGSSLGYKLAGGDVRVALEWDKWAVMTYTLNFLCCQLVKGLVSQPLNDSGTTVFEADICEVTAEQLLDAAGLEKGELDVFDGSPPCQGFSTSGKRITDDPRNQLFMQFVRLLRGMMPRGFVMENVSGLVKGQMKLVFVEVLRELRESGYRVKARVLNAMHYGVPQSRQRLIFVGIREDLGIDPDHPIAETVPPITAEEALRDLEHDPEEIAWLHSQAQDRSSFWMWDYMAPGTYGDKITPGKNFNAWKAHPRRPSPTICKEAGNLGRSGPMHWISKRRFTVAEFRRLFTFPDDFEFPKVSESDLSQYKKVVGQMGNSVPPQFMRAIASRVFQLIGGGTDARQGSEADAGAEEEKVPAEAQGEAEV
jgi:DNA (cytosine-5)-methyltransferase 1